MINLISDVLHGPLWLAVLSIIALLMFAVAGLIFSFSITSVLKEYWQNEKSKQRKAERLKNIATENWPSRVQQHIEQHLSIVQKKKKKSMILNIVWLVTIISGLFVIDDYFDDDRRETYKEMLTIIDDQKELLKQKTLTYSLGTICSDGPVRDHERNRSESLCILEASESVSGRMTNKNAYEACMMKRGWSVRECQDGEQGCVILQTGTGCCNQIGLKTALENISPRCLVEESEESMISRWESICRSRANIEGIEKSMHSELFKIITIYESYKSCMLEQGFYTEQCEMSDEGCVKLLYHESTCTSTIRDWLENRIDENDIVLNKCFAKNNNDFF